jgi:hypothetical protein
MKKTLTAMTLLAGAVSVYSQGAISMNDYNGGGAGFEIQVFPAQPLIASTVDVSGAITNGGVYKEEMGQPVNTYLPHPGLTVYVTGTKSSIGPGYDVGLLALDGGNATTYGQLSLVPSSIVTTWWNSASSVTGGNYGVWNSSATATVPGSASTASVAIAAWQATGPAGAAATLAQAQADGYGWGVSSIQTASLAVGTGSPGFLPTTITSFSLAQSVPEPSTVALGVIGASTLLFRRRK